MAVVIETTLGDITVDLYLEQRPVTCLNFLKLCKMKYYNFNLFHSIRSGFIAQTGDPTAEGTGGASIWGILEGPQKRFFSGEKMPKIRHTDAGLLSMVCTDDMMVGSQFFFTLAPDLDSLDGTHCVIGEVTEGQEVLTKLNEVICDETHRPYRDVRITHTVVLEDPFSDPPGLRAPSRSPSPSAERLKGGRIAPDEEIDETEGKSAAEIQELIDEKEAKARATILEIVGDLPDADIAPPENVLFVCKLNPVTTDDDLEIIFSRFGKIVSCEVIRDKASGNSLQYAFIEFEDKKSCEEAYFKMDNVLIDDRRIHVDFSQSVSKMRWLGKGRGVQYFNENDQDTRNKGRDKRKYNDNENNSIEPKHSEKKHYSNSEKQSREKNYDVERDNTRERRYEKERSNKTGHKKSRSRSPNSSIRNGVEKKHETHGSNKNRRSEYSSDKRESSPHRHRKREYSSSKHREEKRHDKSSYSSKDYNKRPIKSNKSYEGSVKTKHEKHKTSEGEKETQKKKSRHDNIEPKTPSPVTERKENSQKKKSQKKNSSCKTEKLVKKATMKRKRKASSSSDSESSESTTSSSESSSSSDTDSKKKKVRRKQRKESTSSSSGSSESSSTSSSSASSSTSSSSSDSEPKKNKSKKHLNKKVKKSRKK